VTRLVWVWDAPDGSSVILGEHESSEGGEGGIYDIAYSRELAQSWARDLRAGRLPSTEPEVEPAGDAGPSARSSPESESMPTPSPSPARSL
jgi:hypothetical protein